MAIPPEWSRRSSSRNRLVAAAVGLQAVCGALWWVALLAVPGLRPLFRPAAAPDATLLAFAVPDLLLFVVAGLAAAIGTWRHASWAWPVLLVHSGAAAYAALYCIAVTLLTGEAQAAAVLMLPSLVLLPAAVWMTKP